MSAMMSTMEDQERAEERLHMLKGLFPLLKTWYNSVCCESLRAECGPLPQFYQDLATWPHIRRVQRLCLAAEERGWGDKSILDLEKSLLLNQRLQVTDEEIESGAVEHKIAGTDDLSASGKASNDAEISKGISEAKARKKSRWGALPSDSTTADQQTPQISPRDDVRTEAADESTRKVKKSRFSQSVVEPVVAPTPVLPTITPSAAIAQLLAQQAAAPQIAPPSQEQIQQMIVLKMQLQKINASLLTVAQDAARIELDPNRSPSPPPRYDAQGKRTNTRGIRMRDQLMHERSLIADQLIKVHPSFGSSVEFMKSKPLRKIPIPAAQIQNHSFIGLIIGPRGNTQKRMEQETGTKISIKGKGMRGNNPSEEDEPLHVLITGDDEAKVGQAAAMVMELLEPKSEEAILQHKEKQLRELVSSILPFFVSNIFNL